MIRAITLLLAFAIASPAWVESVEFPWDSIPQPFWEGQLVWLKNAGITLDRKSLSELAISSPAAFATLAKQAKGAAKFAVKSAKNAEKAVASKAANAKAAARA